jgi:carbon monoxide dehydrogenase subunit G
LEEENDTALNLPIAAIHPKIWRSLMLRFANTINVERSITEVFNFLSDFENIPKWNYYVLEVTKISEGPIGIGTIYHQVRKTDEQDFRITSFEPNQTLVIKTLPRSSPDFEMRFNLHREGDTTRIQDEWELETGLPALVERLAAGNIKAAVAENLTKLKELLEVGEVLLQDGRRARL